MSDRLDELASTVADALVGVDELKNDPGTVKSKAIHRVRESLEEAKDELDEMEDGDE
jgi:hypothetical protein